MEASPYYAGNSNVVNWAVDHELGFPPASRPVRAPSMINTSPQISTSFEAAWVPRGYAVMHVEGLGSGRLAKAARPPAAATRRSARRPWSTG